VTSGWVPADVGQTPIKCHEQATVVGGSAQHHVVGRAGQQLVDHGVDLVAGFAEQRRDRSRDVLVEFDLHGPVGRGTISSLASNAP
jgi:hypothetical protein